MKASIPNSIKEILTLLQDACYEAYLVGGCVRDFILHRPIHDYDITTSALPNEMMELFTSHGYKVIPTGLKHGTITVKLPDHDIEITTFRIEQEYIDHRHPSNVQFTRNIIEDLKRRDFTMNAIAYHLEKGFYDPFHGKQDIIDHKIRCVGDASLRFQEDALRILRAIRFQCQLHFTMDDACKEGIIKHASLLRFISKERIRDEFNKIIAAGQENTLHLLHDLQVLDYILPGYSIIYQYPQRSPWHCYDVFTHTDVALNYAKKQPLLVRLALVFHDLGKPSCETFDRYGIAHYKHHAKVSEQMAFQLLKLLKYDNKTISQICLLIRYHDWYVSEKRSCMRHYLALFNLDYDLAFLGLQMQLADDYAKNLQSVKDKIAVINHCILILKDIQKTNDMLSFKDLAINGNDVKALHFYGKAIKDVLEDTYQWVLDDPNRNTKDQLLTYIEHKKRD